MNSKGCRSSSYSLNYGTIVAFARGSGENWKTSIRITGLQDKNWTWTSWIRGANLLTMVLIQWWPSRSILLIYSHKSWCKSMAKTRPVMLQNINLNPYGKLLTTARTSDELHLWTNTGRYLLQFNWKLLYLGEMEWDVSQVECRTGHETCYQYCTVSMSHYINTFRFVAIVLTVKEFYCFPCFSFWQFQFLSFACYLTMLSSIKTKQHRIFSVVRFLIT
jgi:hypothetical protein